MLKSGFCGMATEANRNIIKELHSNGMSIDDISGKVKVYPKVVKKIIDGTYRIANNKGVKHKKFNLKEVMEQTFDEYTAKIDALETLIIESQQKIDEIKANPDYQGINAYLRKVLHPEIKD